MKNKIIQIKNNKNITFTEEAKFKIFQIMPAPIGMRVVLVDYNQDIGWSAPVVSLALIEDRLGNRSIEPVSYDDNGEFYIVTYDEYFSHIYNDKSENDINYDNVDVR